MSSNTSLIRKFGYGMTENGESTDFNSTEITAAKAQPTNGTRSWSVNFTANYVMSKRITVGAFFDYQSNSPLVSTSSYPTTNTNYGLSINLSLVK